MTKEIYDIHPLFKQLLDSFIKELSTKEVEKEKPQLTVIKGGKANDNHK